MDALSSLWKPVLHRLVTGRWRRLVMTGGDPAPPGALHQPGLYLHVPFCRNLCPYCPYNRVPFDEQAFASYERAVTREIDLCAPSLEGQRFVSLYIGGGTPTVEPEGLLRILRHFQRRFEIAGDICVELHPANMDDRCLELLRDANVTLVSVGVESANDRLLRAIGRSHDGAAALDAVRRAVAAGFQTVNADLMFALPGQTLGDWEADLDAVLGAGVDQLSTYPLFSFPYTELGQSQGARAVRRPPGRLVRAMLAATDRRAASAGLERCAVWSWLRPNRQKFSSITRHHYVGFGPSAASMTGNSFLVNTFDPDAYSRTLPALRPVALSMPVDRRLELAYWLYWRVYELHFDQAGLADLFGPSTGLPLGLRCLIRLAGALGLLERTAGGYRVTTSGAYWIHRIQNEYSLRYITRLWGAGRRTPWPEAVTL
ncbi:MAG: radical SAM protein [Thermoanaerobaculaceae bacterium]|jgi:oxygen-independent coproporphyrinogen-3 oxidase|nr:radical SAM protein [Thermoanaerobaculaceae bacterium]